jgi:putative transposase
MNGGFVYLGAIIDWYSRYVLSWQLSNSLDENFCVEALQRALRISGAVPDIFNTDQGAQFTSLAFTGCLQEHGIQISMDGKGRALDNVFVERLWRTVKYEEVFLKDYQTVQEAWCGLDAFFRFYNSERFHQSLDYRTPESVYNGRVGLPPVDSPSPKLLLQFSPINDSGHNLNYPAKCLT